MIPHIKLDTTEFDEMLLDVLVQACSTEQGKIDNMCISAYENACIYLAKRGLIQTKNGRIYTIKDNPQAEKEKEQDDEN